MKIKDFLAKLTLVDLLAGLKVTGGYLFQRKETVQYPEKRVEPSDRFRGMFGFDEERCIVCGLCARACPIDIIFIEDETRVDPETNKKKRVILRYDIDVKRCMFCALCQEACPTEPRSVWLTSKSYEGAAYERNRGLYFDKERLQGWEGVEAFPGVKTPREGGLPGDPMRVKPHPELEEVAKK